MEQAHETPTPEENYIKEALEGVDLISVVKEWKKNSIATILEDQIHTIEGEYLLQEELKQGSSQASLGKVEHNGILPNLKPGNYYPKGPSRKRGRKTTGRLQQDLGVHLINEGKVKALTITSIISQLIAHLGTLEDSVVLERKES